ncbi:oxidoreductase-like protein [Podospora appendiculata]|uniref:Oxidoreductase-like protein n=1 Tax=Podospora appendiculata TaxID=314037 RepID=A0AAE0XGR7_9PEZI|nr:oxidoreductase-like protein [Podospora appendiculata]
MTGIALLGAGIFAREEHLPAIEASPAFTLKAVYSRSQKSAEALAAAAANASSIDVYFDSPSVPGKSLDDLLARADVAAVIIALPILTQPAAVQKALTAGKHVLSEKPVASDLDSANQLLAWYGNLGSAAPIWAVAENFRFITSLNYAAEQVKKIGGSVTTFRLQMNSFVEPENKYFNTEWRKTPSYQGGFLLDGGVHFVAGLRLLLAAAGQKITQLAGFSALLEERLLPVDTIHAVALTQDGKSGSIGISFGTEFKSGLEVEIVTTKGAVTWNPRGVKTVTKGADGKKVEEEKAFEYDSGVKVEVVAFGQAIEAGKADPRQTPIEALRDLEILQRLLESGAGGAVVQKIAV